MPANSEEVGVSEVQDLHISDPDYAVRKLQSVDAEALQALCERCADFVMLVEGQDVSPDGAEELFQDLPPGRSIADKFLYGVFDRSGRMDGVLEGCRNYPDEGTWWIGLLMFAPEARGRGLGRMVVESFAEHVRAEHGPAIMLGVVEDNQAAYDFWQRLGFEVVRTTEPRTFGQKVQAVHVMRRAVEP